ncbi:MULTISPECIES: PA4780 family RIO1-like protein kinase [unclassified Thioalkalivibrio]|uniref:PA4780 family RIO1-like protein kinase n=1 Tax=unclassified Thioalkalivibrio TaxID=2621013 RepID=UPI00036123D1|nr:MULTISPECIES: PA4780 family RIO1-like protein kinase [unclassified Thioalkalivibrio]
MKTPKILQPLVEDGVIDDVLAQLQSGKEANIYIVSSGGETRCAKAYKEAKHRGFHKLAEYQEGRKVRGSRDARAMARRGRHGREVEETQWKNAEVEALYRLADAGVRVPAPYGVFDRVLLMELVLDADGNTAPQLHEVEMTADQAREWFAFMIRQIQRMLCAGLIHGDLSEYNVLVDAQGPVIIDLPQAVNAAGNNNAFRMLQRDVNNMRATFGRAAPALLETEYAHEIWELFANGDLTPETPLTGHFEHSEETADVEGVLDEIEDARLEHEAELAALDPTHPDNQ